MIGRCHSAIYPNQRSDAGLDREPVEFRKADILILFDGSESTGIALGNGTRSSVMADAIKRLVDAYQRRIRFGFMLFPDSASCDPSVAPGCCVGWPSVEIGLDQGAAIRAALDRRPTPQGGSPSFRLF